MTLQDITVTLQDITVLCTLVSDLAEHHIIHKAGIYHVHVSFQLSYQLVGLFGMCLFMFVFSLQFLPNMKGVVKQSQVSKFM